MNEVMIMRKRSNVAEIRGIWTEKDETSRPSSVHSERAMHSDMNVSEIMVKAPTTISPESSVADAKWIFRTNKIGGLPVISDGKLVGIVTLSDAKRVSRYKVRTTKIQDVMSKNPHTMHPDEKLVAALQLMNKNHIGRICVVSRANSNKLIGLVSLSDLRRPRISSETKCEYCSNRYDRRRENCPHCGAGRR
jgi:CBS domain-containing protein